MLAFESVCDILNAALHFTRDVRHFGNFVVQFLTVLKKKKQSRKQLKKTCNIFFTDA